MKHPKSLSLEELYAAVERIELFIGDHAKRLDVIDARMDSIEAMVHDKSESEKITTLEERIMRLESEAQIAGYLDKRP